MAVRGKGSSGSLGDAAAAAPAPAAAAATTTNAANAAAARAAAAASVAPAAAAATAGLHPRCPMESSAIFRLHGRGERPLSVCMGEGNEGRARRELLWACVRGCVCAPERARQPRRPAPPASRAGGGPGAGAGRRREQGRWDREGAGGRGPEEGRKVGGLGQPPAPERAWLPPSLYARMPRGSGGCSRPPVHQWRAPADLCAPRGRHLSATTHARQRPLSSQLSSVT